MDVAKIAGRSLACLVAVAAPFTSLGGVPGSDEADAVASATLSVCNLEGGPDNDGTPVSDFPGDDYAGYDVFFGRAGLPTVNALQAAPSGMPDSAAYFAKAGLNAKPGKPFTLIVPRRWRERLSIAWGGSRRTLRLRVDLDCGQVPDSLWVGYPGGFSIDEPACATLLVKTARATMRVQLGIGEPCQGQSPPPTPVNAPP
jgi:hypothetical protein